MFQINYQNLKNEQNKKAKQSDSLISITKALVKIYIS